MVKKNSGDFEKVKNSPFFILSIFFLGLAVGFALAGFFAYQEGIKRGRDEIENSYQEKITEVFGEALIEPEEIFSIGANIIAIDNRILTIEEKKYSFNPLEEPEIRQYQVVVGEETEIVRVVEKTPEEMAAEAFLEDSLVTKEIGASFFELSIGQRITVEARENIKNKAEFEASKIILYSL